MTILLNKVARVHWVEAGGPYTMELSCDLCYAFTIILFSAIFPCPIEILYIKNICFAIAFYRHHVYERIL